MKVLLKEIKPYNRKLVTAPWGGRMKLVVSYSDPSRFTGTELKQSQTTFEGNYNGGKLYCDLNEGDVAMFGQTSFVRFNLGWTEYGVVKDGELKPLTRKEAIDMLQNLGESDPGVVEEAPVKEETAVQDMTQAPATQVEDSREEDVKEDSVPAESGDDETQDTDPEPISDESDLGDEEALAESGPGADEPAGENSDDEEEESSGIPTLD